jgi:glycosyltransferase involved in cell wall biosynthesis
MEPKFLKYRNSNAIPFIKWFLKKNDELSQIVFSFISKQNATNVRFFSLFESSSGIRIVYLYGLGIPFTDRLMLNLFSILLKISKYKVKNYEVIHCLSLQNRLISKKTVYHFDDPVYSKSEISKLKNWELSVLKSAGKPIIVCTNNYTLKYLSDNLSATYVFKVEQGYSIDKKIKITTSNNYFVCVYSSPYIHFGSDKHARHGTWGADLLINQIIPKIHLLDPDIRILLIGELGRDASTFLKKYPNVLSAGRVNSLKNIELMSKCSVGLYPRNEDYKRSMSKIFSYIGAGIPIITFDLIDTEIVRLKKLGLVVKDVDEFVHAIMKLKSNQRLHSKLRHRVLKARSEYQWSNLAKKMCKLIDTV